MLVKCLGSSSSGNCYLMQFSTPTGTYKKTIMIEAGLPFNIIKKRAAQNNASEMLSNLNALLVTHNHYDHCIALPNILNYAIDTYATSEVFEKFMDKTKYSFAKKVIEPGNDYCVENLLFLYPFPVEHDAPNSVGFIIYCQATDERILFINDCKYVKEDLSTYKFDYVFIECNYEDKQTRTLYSLAKQENDLVQLKQYERVINAHMGLATTKKILNKLNLTRCKAIFLMHLSDRHANEYLMKRIISASTKIPTLVCQKNGGIR